MRSHDVQALRHALQQGSPLVVVKSQHIQLLLETLKTMQSARACQVRLAMKALIDLMHCTLQRFMCTIAKLGNKFV
jgi:diaminopimelate decarboxylase